MISLLVHGCYDLQTLNTLTHLGVKQFAFDLRGASPNLIPLKELKTLLPYLSDQKIFLTFENDRRETILSYLDLLKNEKVSCQLIFRDSRALDFYQSLSHPFYWMFNPSGDWKSILNLPHLKGIFFPIKLQSEFKNFPLLWDMVDKNNLKVYLHAEIFQETGDLNFSEDMALSLDLTAEIETSYRRVDQEKLKSMSIWRKINESSAR